MSVLDDTQPKNRLTVMHLGRAVKARAMDWRYSVVVYVVDVDADSGVKRVVSLEDRGITWEKGWGEDIEAALQAAHTLADHDDPLLRLVGTGRLQSAQPNMQNLPRRTFSQNRMSSRKP